MTPIVLTIETKKTFLVSTLAVFQDQHGFNFESSSSDLVTMNSESEIRARSNHIPAIVWLTKVIWPTGEFLKS